MNATFFSIVCFFGALTLACCIASLTDHSKKGQVLFTLLK
jgi:hypothetical protein